MASLQSVGSSLRAYQSALTSTTGDMAAQGVNGQKARTSIFSSQVINSGGSTIIGSVQQKIVQDVSTAGEIRYDNSSTSVAINGDGFIPVRKPGSDQVFLTRVGNFKVNNEGFLECADNGCIAVGYALDDKGERIEGAQFKNINFLGISGKPKATTNISLGMNLDAEQKIVTGAGQTMRFSFSDTFNGSITGKDVIVPSKDNIGIGDEIRIRVGAETEEVYRYGGVMNSFNIAAGIYGKTNATDAFASADTLAPGVAVPGDKIRVKVGNNEPIDLTFVTSDPVASNKQFKSLVTLKDALNQVPGITARVVEGALYIAATDPNTSVSFNDTGSGGTTFVNTLGLSNIPAAAGEKRFATLDQLKAYLQASPTVEITSSKSGNVLNINAIDPKQTITFTSVAERKNPVTYIKAIQTDTATVAGAQGLTSLKIMTPNSGVKAGDYISLSGLDTNGKFGFAANGTENGIYYVTAADNTGFTISASLQLNIGVAGTTAQALLTGTPTWQKVGGQAQATYTGNPNITINAATTAMTIDTGAPLAGGLTGLSANEVVYISGFGRVDAALGVVAVPDGYYKVTAVGANTLTIETHVAAVGGHAAAAVGHNINITRIGNQAGAANHTMATSVSLQRAVDADKIRVLMPNSNYSVGDYFRFGNTTANPIDSAVNGLSFEITAVDLNGNWFEFAVADNTARDAFVAAAGRALDTSVNFIDRYGKLDSSINLSQKKDGNAIDPVYDPSNATSNLASGKIPGTHKESVKVIDSLGITHSLIIAFAKVGINQWAVEVYSPKNADGDYDVTAANGQIAAGSIQFDANGNISALNGLDEALQLNWKNQAEQSQISIDWTGRSAANAIASFATGGITQVQGGTHIGYIDQDGFIPGKYKGVNIDATGFWKAQFDNGENVNIFEMPIIFVPAPDSLKDIGSALFEVTAASGEMLFKKGGDAGVGTYVGNAIEGSNIDNTEKTLDISSQSAASRYLSFALSEVKTTDKELLNRI